MDKVTRTKGFYYCTGRLIEEALKVLRGISYPELSSMTSESLVKLSRRIESSYTEFRRLCITSLSKVEFEALNLVFRAALLRIAAALEERGEAHYDPVLASRYSAGERALAADLERFEALDPEVTPTHVLALHMDSGGELYGLIREAVEAGYVDFSNLLARLIGEGIVSRENSDVFTYLYGDRFSNILRAAKLLLDQRPQMVSGLLRAVESEGKGAAQEAGP